MCSGNKKAIVDSYRSSQLREQIFTAQGLQKLKYVGNDLDEPLTGMATGHDYPFHTRPVLYVDRRDLVYLLGDDFEEM